MRLRWIAFVQLWACAALATEPGKDFSASITWPLYAQRLSDADTVPLHVQVQGCEDVHLELVSRLTHASYSADWQRYPAEFSRTADGSFVTKVDLIKHLGDQDIACWADNDSPMTVDLQVVALCKGDGREATSRTLPVLFSVADFANQAWDVERYFPIDANRVLTVGRDYFAIEPTHPTSDARSRYNGVTVTHYLARQSVGLTKFHHQGIVIGPEAYVADACMFPYCHDLTATDPVTASRVTAQGSTIYHINTNANNGQLVTDLLQVPGAVVRMVQDNDGSILVLSANRSSSIDSFTDLAEKTGWILSRIEGNQLTTVEVDADSTLLRWGGEPGQGPAEISRKGDVYRFHHLKFPHEAQTLRLPGTDPNSDGLGGMGFSPYPSIAPDAVQWLIARGDGLWLSDGVHDTKLAPSTGKDTAWVSTAWQQDTVAVVEYNWDSNIRLDNRSTTHFFDRRTGEHVGQFRLPELWSAYELSSVLALSNDRFMVSGQSGVTIVDARGNALAATRLPRACKGSWWHQELPDGRLLWISGRDRTQQMFVWDIRMYQGNPTR